MTGTEDTAPAFITSTTPRERKKVFANLPATGKNFQLVLYGAEHLAFTDDDLQRGRQDPNHHRAIVATGTAFWDAFLRGDAEAFEWLKRSTDEVLQRRDEWDRK
jgi:hypothetical protein